MLDLSNKTIIFPRETELITYIYMLAKDMETNSQLVASQTTRQLEQRLLISICRGQNCDARVHFAIKGFTDIH
jgi:hypothetical protein